MPDRFRRQRIIGANPIDEIVGEYLPVRSVEDGLRARCPFHDDRQQSLRIDPATGSFQCLTCRVSGDVVDFVRMYEGVDTSKALDMLEVRPPL
jgi:DNA primase